MDSVAVMSPKDRADFFVVASDKHARISAAIIEKDFWVCWILKRIFSSHQLPYHLLFKGGTSLSKVFNSIERFSEDVDLSFDRRELGFDIARDPEKQLSKTEIGNKALKQLNLLQRVVEHKKVFFRSSWAHYETAVPGSFHLVPSAERLASLRADYAQMKAMIFGSYPEWDAIVQGLTELEEKINASNSHKLHGA